MTLKKALCTVEDIDALLAAGRTHLGYVEAAALTGWSRHWAMKRWKKPEGMHPRYPFVPLAELRELVAAYPEGEWETVDAAAARFGVSRQAIHDRIKRKKLESREVPRGKGYAKLVKVT